MVVSWCSLPSAFWVCDRSLRVPSISLAEACLCAPCLINSSCCPLRLADEVLRKLGWQCYVLVPVMRHPPAAHLPQ